jgi:hypothetical protein
MGMDKKTTSLDKSVNLKAKTVCLKIVPTTYWIKPAALHG